MPRPTLASGRTRGLESPFVQVPVAGLCGEWEGDYGPRVHAASQEVAEGLLVAHHPGDDRRLHRLERLQHGWPRHLGCKNDAHAGCCLQVGLPHQAWQLPAMLAPQFASVQIV